jgi:hypothetical protein
MRSRDSKERKKEQRKKRKEKRKEKREKEKETVHKGCKQLTLRSDRET